MPPYAAGRGGGCRPHYAEAPDLQSGAFADSLLPYKKRFGVKVSTNSAKHRLWLGRWGSNPRNAGVMATNIRFELIPLHSMLLNTNP